MFEIEKIKKEYEILKKDLSSPDFFLKPEYQRRIKRYKKLQNLLEIFQKKQKIEKEIKDLKEILEKEKDPLLRKMAKEELEKFSKEMKLLDEKLKKTSKIKESLILEIRAGAGGDEASLWAKDLFLMYQKFAQKKGLKITILDSLRSSAGGFKKIFLKIEGENAGKLFEYESGVHRVQRIPKTEKSGRIHTSTASVAVLKIPEKKEIEISPQDLKIETFRASGPGGQYVQKRETAVRITHIPTNIVVTCQEARSQFQNRENALSILRALLFKKIKSEEEEKLKKERKEKIKRAMRPEKVRTYNFLQSRVTDHRIKKNFRNLDEILNGKLEPLIKELQKKI